MPDRYELVTSDGKVIEAITAGLYEDSPTRMLAECIFAVNGERLDKTAIIGFGEYTDGKTARHIAGKFLIALGFRPKD